MNNFFRTDGWVKTPLGPAIPGAQVYVCTQPANVGSVPPSPLASIYSDPLGANLITQPIYTDGFGHYDFYAVAGVYTLVIVNGGIIQKTYPDQSVGGQGSSGGSAVPGGTIGNLQANNNGVFGGVPGTLVDFTNGLVSIAPSGTGVALSVTGDVAGDSVQSWYVNGSSTSGAILIPTGEDAVSIHLVLEDAAGDIVTISPVLGHGIEYADVSGSYTQIGRGTSAGTLNIFNKTSGGNAGQAALIVTGDASLHNVAQFCINSTGGASPSVSIDHLGTLHVFNSLADSTGSNGTSGQVLSSTVSGVEWVSASGGGALGKWPGNWFGANTPISGSSVWSSGSEWGTNFNITGETSASATTSPTATQAASVPLVADNTTDSAGIYDGKVITPGILQDWIAKVQLVGTTNSRYWIGISDVSASPTTQMVSNTPNQNVIGFRWTQGTDVNIQAVCQTSSSSQTVVDTGVAPTPSTPQVLEIVPVGASSITFYINGTLAATISTNVPANTTVMRNIFLGDTSNIANSWQLNFYYFWMLLSQ